MGVATSAGPKRSGTVRMSEPTASKWVANEWLVARLGCPSVSPPPGACASPSPRARGGGAGADAGGIPPRRAAPVKRLGRCLAGFFLDGRLWPAYTPAGGATAAATPGPWQPSLSVGGWPHVPQENARPNPAPAGSPGGPYPVGHLYRDPAHRPGRGPGAARRPALLH